MAERIRYRLRMPDRGDKPQLEALLARNWLRFDLDGTVHEEWVEQTAGLRQARPNEDVEVVAVGEGGIQGWCRLSRSAPRTRGSLLVGPRCDREEVARLLLDWTANQTELRGSSLVVAVDQRDDELVRVMRDAGLVVMRSYMELVRDQLEAITVGSPPSGYRILKAPIEAPWPSAIAQAYRVSFVDNWDCQSISDDEMTQWLGQPELRLVGSVALRGGEDIAGFALMRTFKASGGDIAVLLSLGVRPDQRRRGVGRAIMSHAIREAAKAGAKHAVVSVDSRNSQKAFDLYMSAGFKICGHTDFYGPSSGWLPRGEG
jgi:ribosomal protein S18 acetylase RimI-like enzyme